MRLAVVSNWQATECGVANFGRDWTSALERAGHIVEPVYWTDPPPASVDLVLYNWHPMTGGYSDMPRTDRPSAVYLHDLPPWSTCPIVDAKAYYGAEVHPAVHHIPYPVWDGPAALPPPPSTVTLGWTGLRGDGRDAIATLCRRRGWDFNGSRDEWLETPEEIQRLAASTLIVLWYFADGRGQSLALSAACATGRPILVNTSRMFGLAAQYPEEIYRGGYDLPGLLEPAVDAALEQIWKGRLKIPTYIRTRYSWTQAIAQMEATWR